MKRFAVALALICAGTAGFADLEKVKECAEIEEYDLDRLVCYDEAIDRQGDPDYANPFDIDIDNMSVEILTEIPCYALFSTDLWGNMTPYQRAVLEAFLLGFTVRFDTDLKAAPKWENYSDASSDLYDLCAYMPSINTFQAAQIRLLRQQAEQ